jgi:hypothetical protein
LRRRGVTPACCGRNTGVFIPTATATAVMLRQDLCCASDDSRQAAVVPTVQAADESAQKRALPLCEVATTDPGPMRCCAAVAARRATSRAIVPVSQRYPNPSSMAPERPKSGNMTPLRPLRQPGTPACDPGPPSADSSEVPGKVGAGKSGRIDSCLSGLYSSWGAARIIETPG